MQASSSFPVQGFMPDNRIRQHLLSPPTFPEILPCNAVKKEQKIRLGKNMRHLILELEINTDQQLRTLTTLKFSLEIFSLKKGGKRDDKMV